MATQYPRRWAALALLCVAQFLVILDTSIIGIALPAIQRALGMSATGLQWVFNAYVIAFGGLLLLGGRLADLAGRRRIFTLGFVILAAGSTLAGFSSSGATLLAGRAIQGLGAALIAPSALSLVMESFTEPKELARAFGFWGGAAAAGGTAGVFFGGVITQWLSWRWTFLVNVPATLLVLLAAPRVLPTNKPAKGAVDVAGAAVVTAALVAIVYGIVTSVWSIAAGGLALVGVFAGMQSSRRDPLVPLSIFRAPNLAAGNVVMALLGAAWIPMWFFLNLYLQERLAFTAFESGLALAPMTTLIMVLMMTVTPKLVAKFGFKANLVVGLLALGIATLLLAAAPAEGKFLTDILPATLLAAIGMSLAYIPATIAAMSGAKPEQTGLASGLVSTTYQVGSAVGLAVTSALAANGAGYRAAFVGAAVIVGLGAAVATAKVRGAAAATDSPTVPVS